VANTVIGRKKNKGRLAAAFVIQSNLKVS